MHGYSDTVAA